MVFLRSFGLLTTTWIDSNNVEDLKQKLNLPEDIKLFKNGKRIDSQSSDANLGNDEVIELVLGLPGGKGGFGSMLRALGNQIQKTTNHEAMRDLSGRRMRDINEEKRLKDYVSKKAEIEREKQEKKEAKLKKLHKLVTPGESKHEFHDKKYDEDREAATDRVHEAIEQVFSDPELKPSVSGVSSKRKASDNDKNSSNGSGKEAVPAKKNKSDIGLFIGADLNDSDFEDSSEDEDSDDTKASGSC